MTQLMELAIERLKSLPAGEQDDVASRILSELDDDQKWARSFSASQDVLTQLAAKAKSDIKAGRVRSLGIDEF